MAVRFGSVQPEQVDLIISVDYLIKFVYCAFARTDST
jgi:hypothetical protein